MIKKVIKYNSSSLYGLIYSLFSAFMFFIVFRPYYLSNFDELQKLLNYTMLFIFLLNTLYLLLIIITNKKYNSLYLIICFFYIVYIISNVFNGKSIGLVIIVALRILLLVAFIEISMYKNRLMEFYRGVYYLLFFYISINLWTMISNPLGIIQIYVYNNTDATPMYFLGNDNGLWTYLIMTVTIAVLYSKLNHKKNKFLPMLCIVMVFVTPHITFSVTAMLSMYIFIFFLLFTKIKSRFLNFKQISRKTMLLSYLLVYFLLIIINPFSHLLSTINLLSTKVRTYALRSLIWDIVMKMIREKPFFGYGLPEYSNYICRNYNGVESSAHNGVLQILVSGGFAVFCILIIVIYVAGYRMNSKIYNELGIYVYIGMFIYFIAALAESPINDYVLIFMISTIFALKKGGLFLLSKDN